MSKLLRVRFEANPDDPRPLNWPVKHPYWITGYAGDNSYSTVVSYADNKDYIFSNWPEAENLQIQEAEEYKFSGRFPKPEWLEDQNE